MSEIGETFAALREQSKELRALNRQFGAAALALQGIAATSANGGVHLVVTHAGVVVDHWPGTGLWIQRGIRSQRRGVKNLIMHLKRIEAERIEVANGDK